MMGRGIFCRWFSTAVAEFGHQKPSRRTLAEKPGQAYGRGSKITHYGFEKLVEREIILSRISARQTARVRMLLPVTLPMSCSRALNVVSCRKKLFRW